MYGGSADSRDVYNDTGDQLIVDARANAGRRGVRQPRISGLQASQRAGGRARRTRPEPSRRLLVYICDSSVHATAAARPLQRTTGSALAVQPRPRPGL